MSNAQDATKSPPFLAMRRQSCCVWAAPQSSASPQEGRLASQKGAPSDENSTNVPALAVLGDRYQAPAKQHCPGQTEQEDTKGGKPADELRWRRLALQQLYDGFLSTLYKGNFGLVRIQPPAPVLGHYRHFSE